MRRSASTRRRIRRHRTHCNTQFPSVGSTTACPRPERFSRSVTFTRAVRTCCCLRTSQLPALMVSTAPAAQWSTQSWRNKPVGQTVSYPDPSSSSATGAAPDPVLYKKKQGLEDVVHKLETLPPIVSATEVRPPDPHQWSARPRRALTLARLHARRLSD